MDRPNFDDDFLAAAARLCYIDGIPQQQAAEMLNISQAKVSRILNLARQRGIVQIQVREYEPRNTGFEERLKRGLGLRDAIVIRTPGGSASENLFRQVGYFGGKELAGFLPPDTRLGLAGGRTIMYAIDGLLSSGGARRITAVQLLGNVCPTPDASDASELGRKLTAGTGIFMALNAPIFVRDKAFRESLLRHEQLKLVMDACSTLDLALVGVGTPGNSLFTFQKVITPSQVKELCEKGAVGEICGHFFDREGRELDTEFRDRVVSIELESLRRIPRVIAVVCGKDRAEAIYGAVKGGWINALLIDETGAERLLQLEGEFA